MALGNPTFIELVRASAGVVDLGYGVPPDPQAQHRLTRASRRRGCADTGVPDLPARSAGPAGPTVTNPALASTFCDAAFPVEVAALSVRSPCRAPRLAGTGPGRPRSPRRGRHRAARRRNRVPQCRP